MPSESLVLQKYYDYDCNFTKADLADITALDKVVDVSYSIHRIEADLEAAGYKLNISQSEDEYLDTTYRVKNVYHK